MPSDGAGGRSGGDGDRGSGGGGRGGGERGGGGRGKKESDFGGLGFGGGGFGIGSVAGNTAAGVGGAGFGGNYGTAGKNGAGGNRGDLGAPNGLRSVANAHAGLGIAGPQLSRARDNSFATGLSYGLTALGMVTGFPGFSIASRAVSLARDYGRGYADRTAMEKAAAANGMGETQRGGDALSSGLSGIAKVKAKNAARQQSQASAAPAKAAASGNIGSGQAGATVIMGADKTRTGAGAGGRAKGSAVRGFGSGGLKL